MRIVYTYGVFDLLHVGHLDLLKKARKLGDKLVVGVFTYAVAEEFKRKPIIPLEQRMVMLTNVRGVNRVVVQNEMSPEENIHRYKVDIVAKGDGAGWSENAVPQFPGIKSIYLGYKKGISTSDIIFRCSLSRIT